MPRLLASIMLVFSCAITQAQGLEPFSVQYRLYVSKIPTTIKADLSLAAVKAHEDIYEMKLAIDSLLVSNLEHSTFRWNDCQPQTQTYVLCTMKGREASRTMPSRKTPLMTSPCC
jgi:hypothetical protein